MMQIYSKLEYICACYKFVHKLKQKIKMVNLQSFEVNGVKLHYTQSGNGQAILFIPGSISDYRTWVGMSKKFEKNNTCYVLSRRFQFPDKYQTHGDSSVAANTEDIATFIRDKKLGPATIVGHSFGGFIALSLAIKYPHLVKSVIAEEPIFAPALVRNPKNPLELLALMFRNFRAGKSFARLGMKGIDPTFKSLAKGDTESAQRTFIDGVTEGKKTPQTLDELTKQQLADNIAALAGEDPFINNLKLADTKQIACKVLLIDGSDSPYVFRFINEQLEKNIPNVKRITIQHAAHWIHIDKPNEFETLVANFINQ